MSFIDQHWYRPKPTFLSFLLLPLSSLFGGLSSHRRDKYIQKQEHGDLVDIPVPVVIVGGICVGGSGKTPLSCSLLKYLVSKSYHPGLISRGYKGTAKQYPYEVTLKSDPASCGDEPLLIKRYVGDDVVVMVDPVRPRGAMALVDAGCDVIISDDGMQHYALQRDIEIMVVDAQRMFGNRHLMPAGPLREGMWRAGTVDITVYNGQKPSGHDGFGMTLKPGAAHPLNSSDFSSSNSGASEDEASQVSPKTLSTNVNQHSLPEGAEVTAMAGIGNPERFYKTVESLGLKIAGIIAVADHHLVPKETLKQAASVRPVVMTAKDAVKYSNYGIDNLYVIDVEGCLEPEFFATVERLILEAKDHPERRSLRARFSRKKTL